MRKCVIPPFNFTIKGGVIGRKRSFASLNTVGSPKIELFFNT